MGDNCLEDRYSSQLKYVQRARQRVSSFWSFTFTYAADGKPNYVLLAEVWHLRSGNIIRQAEGPRPRTIPGPEVITPTFARCDTPLSPFVFLYLGFFFLEAWYWLDKWCEQEGVDLETWDIYSRVEAPLP